MRFTKSAWTAGVMAALITACAGPGQKASSPEELVSARAQARWEALLAERWDQAYGYFTPGHRSIEDPDTFRFRMQAKRVKWTAARVLGAECPEPRVCKAQVEVDYLIRKPMRGVDVHRGTSSWQESWLRSEGAWYYRPKD